MGAVMEKMEATRMTLRGVRSKPTRNPEAERRSRRLKRREYLSRRKKLHNEDKAQIAEKGLSLTRNLVITKNVSFPQESVRGQILAAVIESTVYNNEFHAWIFDGSMRDLASGGLSDGKKHDLSYLLECMADFVRLGILTRLKKQRGRPVIYQINAVVSIPN